MVLYNRSNPSDRYSSLLADYRKMHLEGYQRLAGSEVSTVSAGDAYQGEQLLNYRLILKEIIEQTASRTILDYGCGKGQQYRPMPVSNSEGAIVANSIQDYWGVDEINLYDPGVEAFWDLPEGTYDGVISTDVLEHVPESDIPWVVAEQFSLANKFVFANIACYPALATLPDGSNAHVTVKNPEWWDGLFYALSQTGQSKKYVLVCLVNDPGVVINGEARKQHVVYTNLDDVR